MLANSGIFGIVARRRHVAAAAQGRSRRQ